MTSTGFKVLDLLAPQLKVDVHGAEDTDIPPNGAPREPADVMKARFQTRTL